MDLATGWRRNDAAGGVNSLHGTGASGREARVTKPSEKAGCPRTARNMVQSSFLSWLSGAGGGGKCCRVAPVITKLQVDPGEANLLKLLARHESSPNATSGTRRRPPQSCPGGRIPPPCYRTTRDSHGRGEGVKQISKRKILSQNRQPHQLKVFGFLAQDCYAQHACCEQ